MSSLHSPEGEDIPLLPSQVSNEGIKSIPVVAEASTKSIDSIPVVPEASAASTAVVVEASANGIGFAEANAKDDPVTAYTSSGSKDKDFKPVSSYALDDIKNCRTQEDIKAGIRKSMSKPPTISTFDRYWEQGYFQKIAKHPVFENLTLGVISANAVWMSIETDWNKAQTLPDSAAIFQIVEHSFCTYFTTELFIRFMAFRYKCDGRKDPWFVFDSFLVGMMIAEDWILLIVAAITKTEAKFPVGNASTLRLLRLLRLSRLVRMLRSLPELMILVKGMVQAMTSVLYVMAMLAITTYIFAIACTQLSVGTSMGETYFVNVALAMYSLLVYATFLDNLADFCNAVREESAVVLFVVFLFIFLACLTLMNMLLGVLVEVISSVARSENEDRERSAVCSKMLGVAEAIDTNRNGRVSAAEFCEILHNESALRCLERAGVDPEGVVDCAAVMFYDDDGQEHDLSFEAFMEQIFELRGENAATLRDVKWVWTHIIPKLDTMMFDVKAITERFDRIEEKIKTAMADLKRLVEEMQ